MAIAMKGLMQLKNPVEEASYIVFTDGSRYYAKNGSTGIIEYSDVDATNVIQYAIDKVNALGGGKVLVRRGRYPITKTIVVKDSVVLEGEGWNATILFKYPANSRFGPVLFITGKNIVVRDLAVDGNYTTIPSNRDNLDVQNIVVGNAQYVLIERILSTRPGGYTLTIGQDISDLNKNQNTPPFAPVYDMVVKDSIFFPGRKTYGVGFDGLHIFGSQRIAVVNNLVIDTGDDWIGIGADANYPVSDILIMGNIVYTDYSRGVTLHTGTVGEEYAPNIIRNILVIGNIMRGGGGMLMIAPDYPNCGNCTDFVSDVYLIGNVGNYIYLTSAKNIYIVDNVIYGTIYLADAHPEYPIHGYGSLHDVYIIGNKIYKNIVNSIRGSGAGIYGIHIYDNYFEFCGDIIYLTYGSNYFIKRNSFVGCSTAGSHILISSSASNIVIEGNIHYLVQYAHILLHEYFTGSNVFILNNYFSPNAYNNIVIRAGSRIYIQNNIISKTSYLSASGYGPPRNVYFERNIVLPGISIVDELNVAVKKYNRGYTTENSDVATISAGSTRVTVSHGLATTPSKVLITPLASPPGKLWVENITSTSFDIVTDTAPTADLKVAWYAEV